MNIDDMPAGPEMNAAIAKVIGWHLGTTGDWEGPKGFQAQGPDALDEDGGPWSPSMGDADAWEVMDFLEENRAALWRLRRHGKVYVMELTIEDAKGIYLPGVEATGATRALAICRATLKAAAYAEGLDWAADRRGEHED
jgi:hypothetical protein